MIRQSGNPVIYRQKQLRGKNITNLYRVVAEEPHSALLLSGGSLDSSRFSMIGYDPFCVVRSMNGFTEIVRGPSTVKLAGNPFDHLESILDRHQVDQPIADLPVSAGAIGYFSYELKNYLERLPQTTRVEPAFPELYFCLYRLILIYDRKDDGWFLCCYNPPDEPDDHEERMEGFIDRLLAVSRSKYKPAIDRAAPAENGKPVSSFTKDTYMEAVERVRRYIIDGHVYQVNISQRFSVPYSSDPYTTFISMFRLNPAPFYAFLNGGDFQVLCTSPERLLRQRADYVETRPIKGTRPRGKTVEADLQLREELLASTKDDAELSMIVDLLRNDLSKVCRGGTVRVREHKRIEAYTNVYHLVSIVAGRLRKDRSRFDLLKACFPGGSITGCPKIRSMEIIDEIEPQARGLYTGSIGYLSFHNTMDFNIAIRTAVVKDGVLHFNVGGGIVYDSDPSEEYWETLYKGESILKSLGYTEQGADMG